jgi:hypothetical protein
MNPFPNHDEKLEQLVHRTLRDLPARRAPRSLGQRVLAEIERRAALPWWRKSFAHWPVAARAGFIVLCVGLVMLLLTLGVSLTAGFEAGQYQQAFAHEFAWMESGRAIVNALGDFLSIMGRNIPPLWLYGGLAFFAAMYAALFGLGAAAYKALYARH